MKNKRRIKIENSIFLSIQYSRLLEEVRDSEDKKAELDGKKDVLRAKKRKIAKKDSYINDVEMEINEIKSKNKKSTYTIVECNQLEKQLQKLSNCKFFEMRKYDIAIETILDNRVDYHNTDDYLGEISKIIFQDRKEIMNIQKKLNDVFLKLNDQLETGKTTNAASKTLITFGIQKLKKLPVVIPGQVYTLVLVNGFDSGIKFIKRKRNMKHLKNLSNDGLEYMLVVEALRLYYAKRKLSEQDFKDYFSLKLNAINSVKTMVMKEFFEEWYETKDNLLKIEILSRFDKFLIDEVKFYK